MVLESWVNDLTPSMVPDGICKEIAEYSVEALKRFPNCAAVDNHILCPPVSQM